MLFPGDCRVCGLPLIRAGATPVCRDCLARPEPQEGGLCAQCGEALGMESERFVRGLGGEALLCTPCRRLPPPFRRAVAYGVYEGDLRELLHLFKYERMEGLARPLGAMLAKAILQLEPELGAATAGGSMWLMAPVPLFRAKARERGFNQSALLAEGALRALGAHELGGRLGLRPGLLQRVRATDSQFGLTPHARRRNLRGAFAVAEKAAVAGRRVLLIDDIYTTGATARVCAEVLQRAGASAVLVATLARAQPETVALWTGTAALETAWPDGD